MNRTLLGGLSASVFLRRHWHKTPLLVRDAMPRFRGVLDLREMIRLAGRDDCESRLVLRDGNRWNVENGPFTSARFRRLPARNWTLLVQGVDTLLEEARQLLQQFSFIPYSRLDDLMVSFAPAGGGVGPHFDSYDVFLLQGPGRRRWQISRQRDLALREGIPLKILQRFRPQGDAVLEPGDMLYLPPQFAHDGIALEDCQTYSIGFRAPTHRELASEFLMFVEERLALPGRYADPGLRPQDSPADISASMIREVATILRRIRWNGNDVAEFVGSYLTEPKPSIRFYAPARPVAAASFVRAATRSGLRLAPGSRMLCSRGAVYLNGEKTPSATPALRQLANDGRLAGRGFPRDAATRERLYEWYRAGYILSGTQPRS